MRIRRELEGPSAVYEMGRGKRTIRFSVKPAKAAQRVFLAGDFSNWRPLAMRRRRDGTFVRLVSGLGSVFEYKFILGGEWVLDPDHSNWSVSPIGTLNSVGVCGGRPVRSTKETTRGHRARE